MSAISARNLSKVYRRYSRPSDRVREWVGGRPRHELFWALRDISFEVERGGALGLVGENGAGKSTLLALAAGASVASHGELLVRGRVSSILELGAGFHGDFSGRENIHLAGAAQGLTREQTAARAEEIISFSELGDFIDQPVRTYSSGMFLRLAFSLATATEPEVLVIDEALAVGDQRFQMKCLDRISSFLESGGTLLFCSHNLYQIKKLCKRAIWLDHGRVRASGAAAEVCEEYADWARTRLHERRSGIGAAQVGDGALLRVVRCRAVDATGQPLTRIETGEPIALQVWVERDAGSDVDPAVAVGIVRADGLVCYCGSTEIDGVAMQPVGEERFFVSLTIPSLALLGGSYHFNLATLDRRRPLTMLEVKEGEAPFSIVNSKADWGVCRLAHAWQTNVAAPCQQVRAEGGRA